MKRITQDAAILSVDQQNGTAGSPWRLSGDKGHTFPIVVTPEGSSWTTYQMPAGPMVITRKGAALAALWASSTYDTANLEIWRIQLSC